MLFFVLADVATRFTLTNSCIRPLPQIDQSILKLQQPHGARSRRPSSPWPPRGRARTAPGWLTRGAETG